MAAVRLPKLTLEELEPRIAPTVVVAGFDRTDYPVGPYAYGIATGDFDNDGHLDLAVPNASDDTVTILYGEVGGGFAGATTYPVGNAPERVAAGDFNGDSRLDLAVVNAGDGDVTILYGQGGRSFGGSSDFTVGSGPGAIVTGDFDVDGRLDLAVANGSASVSILYGQPGGGFGGRTDYAVNTALQALAAADLNGDGYLDLVGPCPGGFVVVLYGQAGGGFGEGINYWSTVGANPRGIVTGDFNGDGYVDLAATNQDDGDVTVLYGRPGGGFGGRDDYAVGEAPQGIVAADFNRDGRLDLAVTNVFGDDVSILYGQVVGVFGGREFDQRTDYAVGDWPRAMATGDFNGDGWPDMAVASQVGESVSVLLNRGLAAFDSVYTWQSGSVTVTAYDLIGGVDFDAEDIQVRFGRGDSVTSIRLGGNLSMDGVGIVIHGASSVGSITDARSGPIGELSFIASDAPITNLRIAGPIAGYNLNGLSLGGADFGSDVDGDGHSTDLTALYVQGGLRTARLSGVVGGDVLVGGSLSTLQTTSSLLGDLHIAGAGGNLRIGGDLGVADGIFQVDGILKSLTVGSRSATGHVLSDLLVGADLTKVTIYGDLRGAMEVGGNLGSLVARHITNSITVAGNLKSLKTTSTVAAGVAPVDYIFQNPDPEADGELQVTGSMGKVTQA